MCVVLVECVHSQVLVAGASAVSNQLTSTHASTLAAAGTTSTGSIQIHTVSLDTAQISQQVAVKGISLLTKDGAPIRISNLFLAAGPAGRSESQPSVGVTASDGTVLLTRGEETVWRRDEALSEILTAVFVDLPADGKAGDRVDASHKNPSLMDQIQSQILNLKVGHHNHILAVDHA